MHILHIDEQITWRGGEQQALWLIEGLLSKKIRVSVAGKKNTPFIEKLQKLQNVNVFTLPLSSELDFISAREVAKACKAHSVDIIHAHTSHAHSIAVIAKRFFKAPVKIIVSRRVSFPPSKNIFSRWKYLNADAILPVSFYVAKTLLEHNIPKEKIKVVRSSINLDELNVQPYSREELGIPPDKVILFNAGALVDHKDHLTLIKAFYLANKNQNNLFLLIAGDGPLRKNIEKEIKILGVENKVRLLGHRKDVPKIMKSIDIYVSSSWSEGLGTSVLEALASKKPVIATDAGGISEMVINETTGLLLPPRNPEMLAASILYILQHPEEALRFANEGRKHVEENFSVERMIKETIEVYEEVIGQN
ncbi:MAG: glycosyltransferase family 4 protein [Candidatus Hydrogenedentes bacterium]|nr:glycosyltransferase family 4 protein [Candidatus Hydrogenedentota bacterium]